MKLTQKSSTICQQFLFPICFYWLDDKIHSWIGSTETEISHGSCWKFKLRLWEWMVICIGNGKKASTSEIEQLAFWFRYLSNKTSIFLSITILTTQFHLRLPTYPEFSATGFSWRFRSTTWMIRLPPQVCLWSENVSAKSWRKTYLIVHCGNPILNQPFCLRWNDSYQEEILWGLDLDGFITKPFLKCATGLDFSWAMVIPQQNPKKMESLKCQHYNSNIMLWHWELFSWGFNETLRFAASIEWGDLIPLQSCVLFPGGPMIFRCCSVTAFGVEDIVPNTEGSKDEKKIRCLFIWSFHVQLQKYLRKIHVNDEGTSNFKNFNIIQAFSRIGVVFYKRFKRKLGSLVARLT